MLPEVARTIICEHLTEEEIEQVTAMQAPSNRLPTKKNQAGNCKTCNNAKNSNGPRNPNIICRYCQKKGHIQKECYSRCPDKPPMVDANGKRGENSSLVNNVTDKVKYWDTRIKKYEDAQVGAVANFSLYHHKQLWQSSNLELLPN